MEISTVCLLMTSLFTSLMMMSVTGLSEELLNRRFKICGRSHEVVMQFYRVCGMAKRSAPETDLFMSEITKKRAEELLTMLMDLNTPEVDDSAQEKIKPEVNKSSSSESIDSEEKDLTIRTAPKHSPRKSSTRSALGRRRSRRTLMRVVEEFFARCCREGCTVVDILQYCHD